MHPAEWAGQQQGRGAARYSQLQVERDEYLNRARESARLTLPYLVPPQGHVRGAKFYRPFQSVGARGVNNLAAKLLLALFPANTPFFRYSLDDLEIRQKLEEQPELKTEIETALGEAERALMRRVEVSGDRTSIHEALKHLIVSGNVLLYLDQDTDALKVFHLDRYVVQRDAMGRAVEMVVKESFTFDTLPEIAKELVRLPEDDHSYNKSTCEKNFDIYTSLCFCEGRWEVEQEINGRLIPGSEGTYPADACPWFALRMIRVDGENYGRGYVEEYIGDLHSMEALLQALVEGTAAAAKVLFLVAPNSSTEAKTLAQAPNGAIRPGKAEDVTVVQVAKFADFREARETISEIQRRLEFAFLLMTAIQRTGERVTAEEIRTMAQELEEALGGVYSLLTQELQLPYVRRRQAILQAKGILPKLPPKIVQPAIVTGLEALGRGNDRVRLTNFLGTLAQALGPQAIAQYVDASELIKRLALSDGIDPKGLIKDQETVDQETQAANMAQMAAKVAPEITRQVGQAAQQQAAGE